MIFSKEDASMELKELIQKEVESELKVLSTTDVGSDKYKATVDHIVKLTDKVIDMEKLELESEKASEQLNANSDLKWQEIEANSKDRKTQNRIAIAGLIVNSALIVWGTLKTFKFDNTSTVTSTLGRDILRRFVPRK
jgi:hypothetical protein